MIYYVSEGGIVVNIYTPSCAKVMLAEELWIGIRQKTDYPNSGSVLLTLRPEKTARTGRTAARLARTAWYGGLPGYQRELQLCSLSTF